MADTDGVKYVSNQAGADLGAKVQAAIDLLATTGGWVIVDAQGGTLTSAITIKPGVVTFWYPGVFTVANTIHVNEGAGIIGSGVLNMAAGGPSPATEFIAASGLDEDVIWCHEHLDGAWQGGRLQNFFVDGNKANNAAGSGIRVTQPDIGGMIQCVQVQNCNDSAWRIDGVMSTNFVLDSIFAGNSPYGIWLTTRGAPDSKSTTLMGTLAFTSCGVNNCTAGVRIDVGGRLAVSFYKLFAETNVDIIDIDVTAGQNPIISIYGCETFETSGSVVNYTGTAAKSPNLTITNLINTESGSNPVNLYKDNTTAANTVTWASAATSNRLSYWRGGIYGAIAASWSAVSAQDKALSNGLNSNIALGANGSLPSLRITGPTAGFSLGGFAGEAAIIIDGRLLYVFNTTSQIMTIVNESASSTAANRILTLTGGDVALAASTSFATFLYSGADSRWLLISARP